VAGEAFLLEKNTGFLKKTGKIFFLRRACFFLKGVGCGEEKIFLKKDLRRFF